MGRYRSHWSLLTGARGGLEMRGFDIDFALQAEVGYVPLSTAKAGGTGIWAQLSAGVVIHSFGP